ncbi:MAG: ATP-binding protein [Endomicrobium sp.]|jgi:predicted ATPase|nr:ATP-binding protein [Endomicrobium sp.]
MQLKIEQFGKIKKAEIDLEGLTVITGQNDTGKSTVGKILFWLINELNNYKDTSEKFIVSQFENSISTTLPYLARKDYPLPKDLKDYISNTNSNSITASILENKPLNPQNADIRSLAKQLISFIEEKNLTADDVLKDDYEFIKIFINADIKQQLLLALLLNSPKIFKRNLNNSVNTKSSASIKLSIKDIEILSISIKEDMPSIENFNQEKINLLWKNVDFIESPLMIDTNSLKKIWEEKFLNRMFNIDEENFEISKELIPTAADIAIDKKSKSINYKIGKDAKKLHMFNTASGAKSFIILSILEKLGNFKTDSITVFDEPENHLHPEWQIRYAELLIEFIKKGANIVLTSHSPYLIQGLIHYAKNKKLPEEKFRLLLAEKENEENWSVLKDVTKTPNKIFQLLDEPLVKVFES